MAQVISETASEDRERLFRVLSLDGGGAKGFYTLGVLKEVEGLANRPLCESFDLIFGTSTGSIIASLLALGFRVDDIHALYEEHVPSIMQSTGAAARTKRLAELARTVFANRTFSEAKTGLGLVATNWQSEKPYIFKSMSSQAQGRAGTFVAGFGVPFAEAIQASCSAYPFFERKVVTTGSGEKLELLDGGFCANNPTLYAIADALLVARRNQIRVVSVGVGSYPSPKPSFSMRLAQKFVLTVPLLQKTLQINTESMDQLREVLFKDISSVRISETFVKPELATDMFEHNLDKLSQLYQLGRNSFGPWETQIRTFLS